MFYLNGSQADYISNHKELRTQLLTLDNSILLNNDLLIYNNYSVFPRTNPVNVKKNVGIKADTNKKASTYEDIDVVSFFNNQQNKET